MNTANFPENRARKQAEAQARQAACDALTPQQRLEALDRLGFTATKERAKLQKRIADGAAAASVHTMVVHGPDMVSAPSEPKGKQRRKGRDEKRGAR